MRFYKIFKRKGGLGCEKEKIASTVAALAMAAVTAFSVGGNYAYAMLILQFRQKQSLSQ